MPNPESSPIQCRDDCAVSREYARASVGAGASATGNRSRAQQSPRLSRAMRELNLADVGSPDQQRRSTLGATDEFFRVGGSNPCPPLGAQAGLSKRNHLLALEGRDMLDQA
jgi:hypothetical protein